MGLQFTRQDMGSERDRDLPTGPQHGRGRSGLGRAGGTWYRRQVVPELASPLGPPKSREWVWGIPPSHPPLQPFLALCP